MKYSFQSSKTCKVQFCPGTFEVVAYCYSLLLIAGCCLGASSGFNVRNSAQRANFCNRWNGLSR
jgi:hypothetical protein